MRPHLAGLAATLALLAGGLLPAQAVADPTPVLPDMHQQLPDSVQVSQVDGQWQIGFSSTVANDGPGYLKINGNGPGTVGSAMVADQLVQMSDGSESTVPAIGQMKYVDYPTHKHWHLLDFERYELRKADDPSDPIVNDQKTGFCLANAFTNDVCGWYQPTRTTVTEGLAVHGSDTYLGYREGQDLPIDQATVPDGDYILVNRVNPTGALEETDTSNDAASLRLNVAWDGSGTPAITITNKCAGSIDCAAPPPDPDPDPDPNPDPNPPADNTGSGDQSQSGGSGLTDTSVTPVMPAPPAEPVPVVAPSQFGPPNAKALMSRSMAGRLVRRAIVKATATGAHRLRTVCVRRASERFACHAAWVERGGSRWAGRVTVWYQLKNARLSWFYDIRAVRHPGGRIIVSRAARGSAAGIAFTGARAALFCLRLHA